MQGLNICKKLLDKVYLKLTAIWLANRLNNIIVN